jgi:hypothetical protein
VKCGTGCGPNEATVTNATIAMPGLGPITAFGLPASPSPLPRNATILLACNHRGA